MINPSESNVKLTFEQFQQLSGVQKRLENLQNEITKTTGELTSLKRELEKIVKHKKYLEEMVENLEENVSSLQSQKENLSSDISVANNELDIIRKKATEINVHHEKKGNELLEYNNKFLSEKEEHRKVVESFNNKHTQFLQEKLALDIAKKAFLEAIETVQW